ncbi:AMP-binding protein [Vannielia litorea]|uniref:Long-chain-fatty-acid--CoA ligase n=1 Tax=Vannielia litorea TaxID=1217970 RepID=A0A1N6EFD5_9RHOB|nr:AMP-binding protein [Vannielia litorea]SIN81706.1 long-chain acyl-CoA synthetase [Vannielia litorea]
MSAHFTTAPSARLFGPEGEVPLGAPAGRETETDLLRAALAAAPVSTFCLAPPALDVSPPEATPCFETRTGGTTGTPRRILRSQSSWIASFEVNRAAWSLGPGSRIATLGSLAHSLTLYGALEAVHVGGEAHLLHGLRPDRQQQALAERGITLLWATPAQIRLLGGAPAPALARLLIGGGALDAATEAHARALFPNARIHGFYGAAETSFITLDGRPYPGVTVQIRNPDASGTGEVWLRSPYLFARYGDGPDPHRDSQGFTTVGERGWMEGGKLRLAGRADRAVRIAEQTVQLEEVEAALLALPGVTEAAVIALPDRLRGTRLVAAYTGSATPDALSLAGLPALVRPRRLTRLAPQDWPRRPSGKTDLAAIAAMLAEARSDEAHAADEHREEAAR